MKGQKAGSGDWRPPSTLPPLYGAWIDELLGGAIPAEVQTALYRLGGAHAFGNNRTLRCPHFLEVDGGRCGIWRYRNGVCATWFCKHARGPVGRRFWQALERLLTTVEHQLTRWCIGALDLGHEAVGHVVGLDNRDGTLAFDGAQLDGVVDESAYRAMWGRWDGREHEFFRAAGELVRGLTWPEVLAAAGAEARLLASLVVHRYQTLTSDRIPDRLTVGRVKATPVAGGRVQVVADGVPEILDLPRELWAALPAFDGRPVATVLSAITARHRIDVQPSLLRKLVDFELLVPVAGRDAAR